MKHLIEKIVSLINVKTFVTFVVMGIFAHKSLAGEVESQGIMQVVTMVIAFYFGTQHEKKS